jgi:hypothetical protein
MLLMLLMMMMLLLLLMMMMMIVVCAVDCPETCLNLPPVQRGADLSGQC